MIVTPPPLVLTATIDVVEAEVTFTPPAPTAVIEVRPAKPDVVTTVFEALAAIDNVSILVTDEAAGSPVKLPVTARFNVSSPSPPSIASRAVNVPVAELNTSLPPKPVNVSILVVSV